MNKLKFTARERVAAVIPLLGGLVACFSEDVATVYAFCFPIVPIIVTVIAGKRPFLFGAITGISTWVFMCVYHIMAPLLGIHHAPIGYQELLGMFPLLMGIALLFSVPAHLWHADRTRAPENLQCN